MAKRGTLTVPVIGVASPKWSLARLRARVTDSIRRSGGVDNQRALHHLLSSLQYVSGDYRDAGTFTAIKKALGTASRPAHYLAIPPSLFETVIRGSGAAHLAEHARVIVEKPFGRDLASARALNRVAHAVFPGGLDLPHRPLPRKRGDHEHPLFPIRQCVPRADLESPLRVQCADHALRRFRRGERGAFYETAGCLRDVIQNHLFQIVALLAMEPPSGRDFGAVHDEKAKVFQAPCARSRRDDVVRGQYAGYRKEPDVAKRLRRRDVLRPAAVHRLVALGGRAVVSALGKIPCRHGDRGSGPVEAGAAAAVRRFGADRRPGQLSALPDLPGLGDRPRRARQDSPGKEFVGTQQELYLFEEQPGEEAPYERLLTDAMAGDGALFTREDAVEAAWAAVDPVLKSIIACVPTSAGAGGRRRPTRSSRPDGGWHNP